MTTKNLSSFSDDQFPFLVHNLIKKKESLLSWAKKNNKDKMIKELEYEITLLTEIERRLENGL